MISKHDKVTIVKNTFRMFSIYVLALLLLIGVVTGLPDITSYAPESPVSNIEGEIRAFNITVNQIVNVSWYINDSLLANTYNKTYSAHTIEDAGVGTWFVKAIATNENGTVSMNWTWFVRRYGVNLTADSTTRTSIAGINASYALILHNNGTVTDTYNLTVVNADGASTATLNISGNITLESGASQALILNVTNMSSGISGIFRVNVTARSNTDTRKVGYINTTTTVTAVRGIDLINISALGNTTVAGTNATYYLSLTNNGTDYDTYNLSVTPGDASVASLNITNVSLNAGDISFVTLNVTNASAGIFYVNVTATSDGDATKFASINTTTNVNALRGVNLTNISVLNKITTAGTNATYYLSLTNNGTDYDTYNLSVTPGDASVASLNITNVSLNAGETSSLMLNVTNTSAGKFYVNVTAISDGDPSKYTYINTTTVTAIRGVYLTNISALGNTTMAGTNATYYLRLTNNGTDADTYNLSVTPCDASVASLNITNVSLNADETSFFELNVTNSSAGTFYVNVTARSDNDLTKSGYVDTITTVLIATGSVNGTITDVILGTPIENATITLTNSTGGTKQGETDSSGDYYISGIVTSISDPYIYTISVSRTNYTTNSSLTVTVLNSTTSNTTNVKLSALNGTLGGSYKKNGSIIEVSGATINISNSTLGSIIRTTDSSGSYSASLYPAIYTIHVSKTGYSGNRTNVTIYPNDTTTIPEIPLSSNTVTVTANRTVGSTDSGQNVSFNLTVVNTGDDATFNVFTSDTNANVTNITTPFPLLLNTDFSTGFIVVEVNNSNFGGWPVTITVSNNSQSKSASVTLTAIMRNTSSNYTNFSSFIFDSNVTGGAILMNTTIQNATVTGASLENTTVKNGANVSGNNTNIKYANLTGESTRITDGADIRCDFGDSIIDNSTVGNATVVCSNLTSLTILKSNSMVTNSTLVGASIDNSTLNNVTIRSDSTITNVASLSNITLDGVTVIGDSNYEYEGRIERGNGRVTYHNINFKKVYDTIRISQLVIEQCPNTNVGAGMDFTINDTSFGTSMYFSMTVNLTNPAMINISETGINPDGVGFTSGTQLGNFLVIRSNDTNNLNVTKHILRLYFDTNLSTYSGDVAIYYYNTTASAWDVLETKGRGIEGGRPYIQAAPNHFSTFALVRTMTTPTKVLYSGGNSGGGGGGGMSGENISNMELIEKYDLQISRDVLASYQFNHVKNPVMFVNITGNTSPGLITTSVEVLKNTSTLVNIPPNGIVYKNVNIWVGTSGFASPRNIKLALVKFKVNNSWMDANGVSESDIVLMKWDRTGWIKLETKVLSKDDANTYFETNTRVFSNLAITALKVAVVPDIASTGQDSNDTVTTIKDTGTENPESMPTKEIPGFGIIIAVYAIVIICVCFYARKI